MNLVVFAFIGVRGYKQTIYCAMRLVFPYVFLFVFRIARTRTVWVTVIFKAWFLNISYCFLYCVQNIFSFGFIKAFDSKQIRSRTCKDCVISREIKKKKKMAVFGESCWNVDTRKMLWSVLKIYIFGFNEALASKGIGQCEQPWFLKRDFLNISYCFLYCVQNIFSFGFIKAFDSKQIRSRTCKDCVISREINTLLKMAVFGESCWNVDTRKMSRSVLKRFFFGFIETLASKGILNTLKKGITSVMESADLAAFTFATWLMRSLTL